MLTAVMLLVIVGAVAVAGPKILAFVKSKFRSPE